jgi:hypothetical protein
VQSFAPKAVAREKALKLRRKTEPVEGLNPEWHDLKRFIYF